MAFRVSQQCFVEAFRFAVTVPSALDKMTADLKAEKEEKVKFKANFTKEINQIEKLDKQSAADTATGTSQNPDQRARKARP